MSTENKGGQGAEASESQPDPIQNLKSEFNRKLDKQEKAISDLLSTNQALLAQIQKTQAPKDTSPAKKISDVWYDRPEEAAELIRKSTIEEVTKMYDQRESRAANHNQTISKLYSDFPELADINNPLTQKASEIYKTYSKEEQSNPKAMVTAALEAAAELGVAKASKRQKSDGDDFVMSGNGSNSGGRTRGKKEDAVPEKTLEFARMMGMDVEDPEVIKRLATQSARKDWNKYKAPK